MDSRPKFSIQKASEWLIANAYEVSHGNCARHYRLGLENGGLDTNGRPEHAGDYGTFLEKKRFKNLGCSKNYNYGIVYNSKQEWECLNKNKFHTFTTKLITGDTIVLSACKGHECGHIAMLCHDNKWYSDFEQHSPLGCKFLEGIIPEWSIYRYSC